MTELQTAISENENIKKDISVMKEKFEETTVVIVTTNIEITELKNLLKEMEIWQDNLLKQSQDHTDELEKIKYIYECINGNIMRTEEETRQKVLFLQNNSTKTIIFLSILC